MNAQVGTRRKGRCGCPLAGAAFQPQEQRLDGAQSGDPYGGGSQVKTTAYFQAMRVRPDRAVIEDEWIERVCREPMREQRQADGRIRRWAAVPEADGRFLRVVLLTDGETVHNAFFDRGFKP